MFTDLLLALVATPPVLGVAWLCLRRYNPETRLAVWRRDRPKRTVILSLVFGAGAALFSLVALIDLTRQLPWYEYVWTPYSVLWAAWLLAMRAAAIEQLEQLPT